MERTPEEEVERARIRRERDLLKNPDMERDVPRVLRLRRDDIAVAKKRHGITERITKKQANRWTHHQDPVPDWLQEAVDRRNTRNAARSVRGEKKAAERRQAVDAAYVAVKDRLLAGTIRFKNPLEEEAATEYAFQALREFIDHHGNATWLTDLERAALRYIGVNPRKRSTWPFTVPADKVPHTGFLESLVGQLGEVDHLLTVMHGDLRMSTAINRSNGSTQVGVEYPSVVRFVEDMLVDGDDGSFVLRTFNDPGADAESRTISVRGWNVRQGTAIPLTEAQIFTASCTDHQTNELLTPERGVEYREAWSLYSK